MCAVKETQFPFFGFKNLIINFFKPRNAFLDYTTECWCKQRSPFSLQQKWRKFFNFYFCSFQTPVATEITIQIANGE